MVTNTLSFIDMLNILLCKYMIMIRKRSMMKWFAKFLIVAGVICVILGIIGNTQLSNAGMTGEEFEFFSGLSSAFGVSSYLSAGDQLTFWLNKIEQFY
ncbi:hypothetical protein FACS1894184_05920 [Clostridia bacterium]|nr:hypothetical protein FACS1894184_05920 [Clostridia bacterium]